MGADVLVLNKNFYAIHITNWRRALSLLYLDHARVVDQEYRTYNFSDWQELSKLIENHPSGYIRTPSFRIAMPEVITLRIYDELPVSEIKFTRRNIYEHYSYLCCYCGKKFQTSDLNLEHIIPKSRGGQSSWNNVVTSCISCNIRKGNRLPDEAGMRLLITPSKPKWRGAQSLILHAGFKVKASWQRFIDNVYWNSELEAS
jgi:5-methylcytosine-specific restriction endonuclease McrA